MDYVLVSYTTTSTFPLAKYGEEYMFDFYKSPTSENASVKEGKLVILFKKRRLPRKTKALRVSQKLIKIVHFRELFYFKRNMEC